MPWQLFFHLVVLASGGVWLYAMNAWLRRTARAWNMVCLQCNSILNRDGFQYRLETENCPHCVRKRVEESQPADEADADLAATGFAEAELNPYAPPHTNPKPATPMPMVVLWMGRRNRIEACLACALFGWCFLAFFILAILITVCQRFSRGAQADEATPPWMDQAIETDRARERWQIAAVIVIVALCFGGYFGWSVVAPYKSDGEALLASHFALGLGLAIAFAWGTYDDARMRRKGLVIPQYEGIAAVRLPTAFYWRAKSPKTWFRTQGTQGVAVTITDTLTTERLIERTYPATDPDGWSELRLPFDEPAVAGRDLKRLQASLRSLDGRPWLLRLDRESEPLLGPKMLV